MQYRIDHHNAFPDSYSREQVQAFIDNGQIGSQTKVWRADWSSWKTVSEAGFDVASSTGAGAVSGLPSNLFLSVNGYLRSIDEGGFFVKVFQWTYLVFAVLNIFFPLYLLYAIIDNNIMDAGGSTALLIVVVWITTAVAGWFSAQIWWDRRAQIGFDSTESKGFHVSNLFSNFIQTLGEWVGTFFTVIGFVVALLVNLFEDDMRILRYQFDFLPLQTGIFSLVIIPIYGFLMMVSCRFVAEQIRALFMIANNTRGLRDKK